MLTYLLVVVQCIGYKVRLAASAGRDSKMATCIMYYSYGDAQKMRHMLKQSAEENGTSKEQMQHNTDSLNSMVDSLTNCVGCCRANPATCSNLVQLHCPTLS